jgi:hypothetical protein
LKNLGNDRFADIDAAVLRDGRPALPTLMRLSCGMAVQAEGLQLAEALVLVRAEILPVVAAKAAALSVSCP